MSYKINKKTLAILPDKNRVKVYEGNHNFNYKETVLELIDRNCCSNGSNLFGRQKGASYLLGSSYKPPIIINEINSLILVPTHSIRNKDCSWVMLHNLLNYKEINNNKTLVEFKNGKKLILNCSFNKFDRQIIRATRLESILRGRNN